MYFLFRKLYNICMIDEAELYNFYIKENHSRDETAKHFNLSLSMIKKMLSIYGIKKDHKLASQNNKNKQHMKGKKKYIENGKIKFGFDVSLPISYEELYHDYVELNTPRSVLADKYNISESKLKQFLSYYNIKKSKSLSMKNRKSTFEEALKKISKDELIDYYITKNHSREECCSYFNVSITSLKKIIKYYELEHKDRSLVSETNSKVLMEKYGVSFAFDVNPKSHNNSDTKPNLAFKELLENNNIEYTREFSLGPYKYDFKVGNILVEINPTITHNITYSPFGKCVSTDYHKNKTNFAHSNGYRCINVWDWDDLTKIIFLIKKMDRIYARQCELKEVSVKDAKEFINKYHIQNYCKSVIRLGLYFNDELVSIMTFDRPRYNKNYEYELLRFCACKNIVGGKEKLFNYFKLNYSSSIVSYCDLSKFSGKSYIELGLTLKRISAPTCHWYNGKIHITDNLLRLRGYDQLFNTNYGKGVSNTQLMLDNGFVEIYDCGQATFVTD